MDVEKIILRNQTLAWERLCALLGNEEDASDCLQDVVVTFLEIAHEQKTSNPDGLFSTLTYRTAIDLLRSRKDEKKLHKSLAERVTNESPKPGPLDKLLDEELLESFRCTLAILSDSEAEVFCLWLFDDLPYKKIAKKLNLKAGNVGVMLHRSKEKLGFRLRKLLK
jgi:RNA polymerase sigma factor (sigma-70 family)